MPSLSFASVFVNSLGRLYGYGERPAEAEAVAVATKTRGPFDDKGADTAHTISSSNENDEAKQRSHVAVRISCIPRECERRVFA